MTASHNLSSAGAKLLFETQAFAEGLGLRNRTANSFAVTNPADGSHIADVPDMGALETEAAVAAAKVAFADWSARPARARADTLRRWYDLILQNKDALAELLTLEQGKPLAEAVGEIVFGAQFIEWFAEEGKRLYGDIIPTHAADKRCLVLKQPIGVVGAITPWNFPSSMITRKVSPALAAGCTIIIKPAEDTPLSALALQMLAEASGFPHGVMTVITAKHAEVVAGVLTSHPDVRKISFTGSTRVGKLLMQQCAGTVKKLSLELGGNSPFIVFDDADLDAAVAGAIVTKFRNAGQACVATNRIYVQSDVMAEFAARLKAAIAKLQVGPGLETGSRIGPMINQAAVEKGAYLALGGALHERGGQYFTPTLLTGATHDMDIAHTEIFGPVAALYPFETEAVVIALANDTPYGLAAYYWTRDIGRVFRVGEALEYGLLGANEVLTSNPATPFGGVKESGLGREGSKYGLEDFVEIKYLALGGI